MPPIVEIENVFASGKWFAQAIEKKETYVKRLTIFVKNWRKKT